MEERLRDLPFPPSYRPFVPHERAARMLRMFQVTLIPGLFQTPEYARAMLAARPHVTADEVGTWWRRGWRGRRSWTVRTRRWSTRCSMRPRCTARSAARR